jgi:type IV secretory pathway VirB4 component
LQKWHEHKEKLPAPLAKEIEKIVEQIGTKIVKPAPVKPMGTQVSLDKSSALKTPTAKRSSITKKTKAKSVTLANKTGHGN